MLEKNAYPASMLKIFQRILSCWPYPARLLKNPYPAELNLLEKLYPARKFDNVVFFLPWNVTILVGVDENQRRNIV